MKSSNRSKLLEELGKNSNDCKGKKIPNSQRKINTPNLMKTILVIDDNPEMIELLSKILSNNGYNSIVAESVKEGITKLQSNSDIALIICDLLMPEEDGFSMLRYLKSNLRFRNIQVIVCSGLNDENAIKMALKYGAQDYLVKPFTPEQLISKTQKIIDSGLGTILVVTEENTSSKFLVSAISRIGYRVLLEENGESAVGVLSSATADGIVSELALMDMTGLDLMVQCRDLQPGIPVMFIHDHLLKITENDIISAGGNGILRKPFNNHDIALKVAKLVFNKNTLLKPL